MGERGLPARLLAPRYGGYLTFGALAAGRESAPGQPTVEQLRNLYRLQHQRPSTQVHSHSRLNDLRGGCIRLPSIYIAS